MATFQKRITHDGETRWRVLVRLQGHPVQTATFERKSDAQRWAKKTESAILAGRHFPTGDAKKRTFAELVER